MYGDQSEEFLCGHCELKELNLVVMGWPFLGLLISFGMLRDFCQTQIL